VGDWWGWISPWSPRVLRASVQVILRKLCATKPLGQEFVTKEKRLEMGRRGVSNGSYFLFWIYPCDLAEAFLLLIPDHRSLLKPPLASGTSRVGMKPQLSVADGKHLFQSSRELKTEEQERIREPDPPKKPRFNPTPGKIIQFEMHSGR
jgi:hypothetical protein